MMRGAYIEEADMRGAECQQAGMWSHISTEQRVPSEHPPRPIRPTADFHGEGLTLEVQAAGPESTPAARLRKMDA